MWMKHASANCRAGRCPSSSRVSRTWSGATSSAEAVVLATEWNEFRNLDLAEVKRAMHGDVLVDSRNVYDHEMVKSLGFRYFGVGRR